MIGRIGDRKSPVGRIYVFPRTRSVLFSEIDGRFVTVEVELPDGGYAHKDIEDWYPKIESIPDALDVMRDELDTREEDPEGWHESDDSMLCWKYLD